MAAIFDHAESLLEPTTLKAGVLYDDFNSGCRAKVFFDQLTARLDGEVQFSLALWRLDVLLAPGGLAAASCDLGCAEMLVLALGTESVLPAPVLERIETWAKCQLDADLALVVLGDRLSSARDPSRGLARSLGELRDLAERHGVSFFCEWPPDPSRESVTFVDHLRQREHSVTDTIRSILAQAGGDSYRHWGLND